MPLSTSTTIRAYILHIYIYIYEYPHIYTIQKNAENKKNGLANIISTYIKKQEQQVNRYMYIF